MGTKENNKKYYEANKAAQLERNRQKRIRNFAYVTNIKESTPCTDCKVNYPHYVMDFDHVKGIKIADVSRMCNNYFSLEKIQEEIDKCELVCANCHRERTFSRMRL